MIECETITKKWGNSMGVTLPKEVVKRAHLKEHERIRILILKQDTTLKNLFGMVKSKKSGQQIKDEIRRELHGI